MTAFTPLPTSSAHSDMVDQPVDPALHFGIDVPLPPVLHCGLGSSSYLSGWCFHEEQPIRELTLLVNRRAQRVSEHGLYRADVEIEQDANAEFSKRFCGFWTLLDIQPPAEGAPIEILVQATLADGRRSRASIGYFRAEGTGAQHPAIAIPGSPSLVIALPTFEPRLDLFARQIRSIRSQTFGDWCCVISDDASTPATFEGICAIIGDDPRFIVVRHAQRVGAYRNFERTLTMLPPVGDFIALADQDDCWDPDKLETLRWQFGPGDLLAYSDCRVVDDHEVLLSSTFYVGRRNNFDDLMSMVFANTIPSASMMFRRELLDCVLPFPDFVGFRLHDHWIASSALSHGKIAFVDRTLYGYVQHGENAIGWGTPPEPSTRFTDRMAQAKHAFFDASEWFFADTVRVRQYARNLLFRGGGANDPGKLAVLKDLASLDASPAGIRRIAPRLRGWRERRAVTQDHERRVRWGLARTTVDGIRAQIGLRPRAWERAGFASSCALGPDPFRAEPDPFGEELPLYTRGALIDAVSANGAPIFPPGTYLAGTADRG